MSLENLKRLRRSLTVRLLWVSLISSFCGILAFSIISTLTILPATILLISAVSISLLIGLLFSFFVITPAMSATEFLAKAILHVSLPDSTVSAPEPLGLGSSKEYLEKLASYVYEAVSASPHMTQTQNSAPTTVATTVNQPTDYYSAVLQSVSLPTIVLDASDVVTFCNTATMQYLQLPQEDIIGKPVFDALSLQFPNSNTLEDWIKQSRQNTVTSSKNWERVKLTLASQTIKQLDMAAHFSKGNSLGIETVLVLFDHTERYSRDDRDLSFVSLAVHELRTPLTIMKGYIEVFQDELGDKLDVEQAEFMRNMGASAEQLTAFVSNILNVARIESDELVFNLKEESWADALTDGIKMMELRARVKHKQLSLEIQPGLPTVGIDKVSMLEVIANLVDNSLKYQHTDEPIEIKSYLKDGQIVTEVRDHGIGIPESLLGHIFEKFYRSHKSKKSVSGTGLGLYLCREIVNAHGGQIWAESHEGQGAVIGFSLPQYATIAASKQTADGDGITRSAHGWIKNHTLYRR